MDIAVAAAARALRSPGWAGLDPIWTSDLDKGLDVARRVETGTVGVNFYDLDIGAPFGGVKASGLGRELGPEGLAAYVELKSIYLPRQETTVTASLVHKRPYDEIDLSSRAFWATDASYDDHVACDVTSLHQVVGISGNRIAGEAGVLGRRFG